MRPTGLNRTELLLGDLRITFHKTERVPDAAQSASLPPSRGHFSIYDVKDYKADCPSSWNVEGIFLPVQSTEAMWMSFRPTTPVALTVGAGGINAVTGNKLAATLEKDAYLVAPPQPWLDGWKNQDGTVRQFVCAEYKGGAGMTVGEQLIGSESKTGGIAIALFTPIKPLPVVQTPSHHVFGSGVKLDGPFDGHLEAYACASAPITRSFSRKSMVEMGVGAGGKITQKIYPDPYGLEVWNTAPSLITCVYLVSAEDFATITGQTLAPPATQKHPGFKVTDGHLADVPGTTAFEGLKPATAGTVDKNFFPG